MAKSVFLLIGVAFFLAIDCSFAIKESTARTLYVAEKLSNRILGKQKRDVLTVEWRADEEFVVDETGSQGSLLLEHLARKKRQAQDTPGTNGTSGIQKSVVHLNDSHNMMYIHWAGAGSEVIVALSRDQYPTSFSTSRLYISYDYGKNFTEKFLRHDSWTPALFNYFLNSPVYNSHYVFVDILHSAIWTTVDYGVTIQKHTLQFVPRYIELHPTNYLYMFGYNSLDYSEREFWNIKIFLWSGYLQLWVSSDFGSTWRVLRSGVSDFYWGIPPYDNATTVYVHASPGILSSAKILKYSDFRSSRTPEELFTGALDFNAVNEFLFATKQGSWSTNYALELWVSYNRGTFQKAFFPSRSNFTEFFIADATEDQVFVCACINSTSTNLYISGSHGTEYSLSLENIMYYSPSYSYSWLSGGSVPFADLRKIEGLNGIYIATQVVSSSRYLSSINQITLMTFNKGGDWHVIPAPERTRNGNLTCGRTSTSSMPQANCSLHLVEKFLAQTTYSRYAAVFTSASAIGLVMANGNIGSRVSSGGFNVYLSNDGGLRWNEVLGGTHYCTMGDHGGLIVAIRMYEITGDLMYSYDEGETWNSYTFIESPKIRVYGLLTEPGEETTVFSIFGSWADTISHSWIVIQVNLSSVLGRPCTDADYKEWAPTDDPNIDCLLGRKTVYERRKADAVCFNGREYDREIYEENCPCKIEDYECDVGYRKNATNFNACEYDPASGVDPSGTPENCPEGSYYNRTKGYRRVVGDTCEGGLSEEYEPVRTICPVTRNQEFLLFVNRTTIHRYIFERRLDEVLPLGTVLENAISLEYDYANDCIFWADSRLHNIQTRCLRGSDVTTKVLITENTDLIEGLAYNWMSQQLFWVDSGHKRIEVARKDGTNRKVLINTTLDQPRAIVLYPKFGYMFWTDWSATNPRVTRAAMDGSNMVQIVNGTDKVYWPNGLAIDEQTMKIFITDAYLDRISCFDFWGQGFRVMYQQSAFVQHPYAIGVFKDQLYWTDWSLNAVMMASKHGNQTIRTFISGIPGIMDLKVFHVLSQQGQSACNVSNGGCQSLCFEKPNNSSTTSNERVCHCADVFNELPDGTCSCGAGEILSPNGTCHLPRNGSTCASYQFSCTNGNCVPQGYTCDGDNDCLDWSDELGCAGRTCQFNQFKCNNGRCIPSSYLCDHDNDCGDMSDEPSNCSFRSCAPNQFQCNNGRCISSSWHCDLDNDCQDGSDEFNCEYTTRPSSCSTFQFQCQSSRVCIPRSWICDSDRDCSDGSDEANCNRTSAPCTGFLCTSSSVCLASQFRCDGRIDCDGGEDEQGCSTTPRPATETPSRSCLPFEFKCASGQWCIPYQGLCDGISDCPDNSDEIGCSCPPADHFRCANGHCIQSVLRCNMRDDCRDNSDELDCVQTTTQLPCSNGYFRCGNGDCIPQSWVCDGERDCASSGDDEWHCSNVTTTCSDSEFQCYSSYECIPWSAVCDKNYDCEDHSDELDCSSTTPAPATCLSYQFTCVPGQCLDYQLRCDGVPDCFNSADEQMCNNVTASLSVEKTTENSVMIKVDRLSSNIGQVVRFFTLLRIAETRVIVNESNTTAMPVPCILSFDELSSDTEYVITVAVILNGTQGPPSPELRVRTTVTVRQPPGPPQNVSATTVPWKFGPVLNISWARPDRLNGVLVSYKIYVSDLNSAQSNNRVFRVEASRGTSYHLRQSDITYGHKFKIEISASNGQEGRRSDPVTATFAENIACVMLDCSLDSSNVQYQQFSTNSSSKSFATTIYLSWKYNGNESADGVTNYSIRIFSKDILYNQTFTYIVSKSQADGYNVQVMGLNPSTSYSISVTSQLNGKSVYLCPDSVCRSITTTGLQLPEPNIESAEGDVQSINVSISCDLTQLLNSSRSDTNGVLSVLYKKDSDLHEAPAMDFFSGTSTKNISILLNPSSPVLQTVFTLSGLAQCEQYCFVTMLVWPLRSLVSPMMCASPQVNVAPSEFRVEPITNEIGVLPQFVDVVVSFMDRCRKAQMNYFLSVQEVGTNKIHVNYVENATYDWSSALRHLFRGATYNITVQRDFPGSTPNSIFFRVDPFSAPTSLDFQMLSSLESTWIFSWEMRNKTEVSESCPFGIYYSQDVNSTSYTLLTTTAEEQVIFIGKKSNNKNVALFFKVRFESCYGYPGEFSEVKPLLGIEKVSLTPASTDEVSSNSMALAVAVPLVIIMVIILAILGVLCGRHYLLRRSLRRFELSRYDSHSNSAMFNDLADDDAPLVQNFSEDVPMIVP